MLYGAPKHLVAKLQNVQNAAACIIVRLGKHDHSAPVLRDLHWLPVERRIVNKINLLTFKCIHGLAPKYLQDLLDVCKAYRSLHSSTDSPTLNLPLYNMKSYVLRSILDCSRKLWKELHSELSAIESISIFKAKLKTHLLKAYFT